MTPSSLLSIVGDAAMRSLLVGAVVGVGMAALRVRNVVAQKAAWTLVLVAALLMPWAARWAEHLSWLPQSAQFVISASRWTREAAGPDLPGVTTPAAAAPLDLTAQSPRFADKQLRTWKSAAEPRRDEAAGVSRFPAPSIAVDGSDAHRTQAPAPPATRIPYHLSAAGMVLLVYLAGCGVFLFRLFYGAWAATWLWTDATPVWLSEPETERLRVRSSDCIASPVTIGSGVILPAGFDGWDAEKLRIVLAHEASHVRQRDFYLQLCASLYAAMFWFSPLGWWLKRKLGDLSETISDRAAVGHAASHASYAQVLLEFAALPRPIPMGVAMAHHGQLIPRIERLLNESSFRQAFAGGRARIAAAVLLVPAALFAATAMVRVEAAQQAPPQQDAAPPPAAAPAPDARTGTAVPPAAEAVAVSPQAPAAPAAPSTAGTATVAPIAPSAPIVPDASIDSIAPLAPDAVISVGPGSYTLAVPNARIVAKQAQALALLAGRDGRTMALRGRGNGYSFGYGYGFGNDGNSYAYVTGSGEKSTHFSGNWYEGSKAEIEKARKIAHGDFIWFERDGKSYVIDDPAALAGLKPMQDKMEALGAQQEELGKQQEALGKKQEELGRQQEQASVPTPDVSKELAQLTEAIKKLDAQKGGTVTADQLGDLESKIGDLQGKIGDIQGKIGEKQGEFGEKQGALGEQQGKLGEQQGRLGEEQGRIAREMDGKVLTMIDEYMKNGKARPVQ
jgi:beta-lactamase regulating signal transducer with metallopeptidase domain